MTCEWVWSDVGVVCAGPSKSFQGLVERLKVQLTDKEQQLEGLRRALQQVRADLTDTTQRTIEVQYC